MGQLRVWTPPPLFTVLGNVPSFCSISCFKHLFQKTYLTKLIWSTTLCLFHLMLPWINSSTTFISNMFNVIIWRHVNLGKSRWYILLFVAYLTIKDRRIVVRVKLIYVDLDFSFVMEHEPTNETSTSYDYKRIICKNQRLYIVHWIEFGIKEI